MDISCTMCAPDNKTCNSISAAGVQLQPAVSSALLTSHAGRGKGAVCQTASQRHGGPELNRA